MARSDTTEANFPFTMLYFQGNFHLAYCVCKCKHHPRNTVLGMSWKISIVTFILQMSKSHVQSLEDERKTSMLQGGLLHIAQKEVVCLKHVHTHTHTHKHFSTFQNLAAQVYGHPSFRRGAVATPVFCFSWCLPSLPQR